ncbi:potassium transporter 19 [Acrodontium crateriforme]|uniref:Potassium transporter 19 n=1 Tax=Acrodontium crateriforme TaxID=150365 RepID=A0AAQ3M7Z4_9PEZI|nr:potassium transporter 19 [Acrodontium crateriforme]
MANATTIQFDDDQIRRARSHDGATTATDITHGIVYSRTVSMGRNSSRGRSLDRSMTSKTLDADVPEESGLTRPADYKSKQVFRGSQLFFLAYQSIGVIYGDIGTSPLYVYSSVFGSTAPTRENLIGVLSLVIWSLIAMVTIKYVLIILHADNDGEGGTFSCYSLLSRYARITNRDPREETLIKMERYRTNDMHPANLKIRNTMEKNRFLKGLLKTIGVLAVSMVISDGVLTPAQSVLGAVQGLNVVVPDITNATVVGTTCGILVLLFLIQPFGTTKIGVTFAPVIIVWLGMLAGFGIYNLIYFDAGVAKAFNPGEAFNYLIRNGTDGWKSLGGVLLAFTGVEALFADLGAFSMRAIQISWLCWCLPCLILAYVGQAAYIAVHPDAYAYPVFYTAPPGCLIPILVVAILAAIVASQAIITATFQLMAQIIKLSYFPQIQVIHTSKIFHNQLYVPIVNYLLMIGTVIVTAVYNNTTSLGNAYGVCVMFVTFFDTCMVTLTALIVWRFKPYYVILPWLAVACLDGTYLSSALLKVPDGAWFTLALASVLASLFILWRFGKEQQWSAEQEDRIPLVEFVKLDDKNTLRLTDRNNQRGGESLSITKGFGIFFDKGGINTPMVFSQFIGKLVSTPEVIVFFHMRPLEYPTISPEERFIVSQIKHLPNCYRVVCRHGYMDEIVTHDLASIVYSHVRRYVLNKTRRQSISQSSMSDFKAANMDGDKTSDDTQESELVAPTPIAQLEQAFDHRVLYIIGKEEMHVKTNTAIWRKVLLKVFLFMRDNTRNKMANLKVPTDRLVEIGFIKDV